MKFFQSEFSTIIFQIQDNILTLTKFNSDNTQIQRRNPELPELISEPNPQLFQFLDEPSKTKSVSFLAFNNKLKTLHKVECDLNSLLCSLEKSSSINLNVIKIKSSNFEKFFLITKNISSMQVAILSNSLEIKETEIYTVESGILSIDYLKGNWYGITNQAIFHLRVLNGNKMIVKESHFIAQGIKFYSVRTTENYLAANFLDKQNKNTTIILYSIGQEIKPSRFDIFFIDVEKNQLLQWEQFMIFFGKGNFILFRSPSFQSSSGLRSELRTEIHRDRPFSFLNSSAFFSDSALLAPIPNGNTVQNLSLLMHSKDQGSYFLNKLAISSFGYDCSNSTLEKLKGKNVKVTAYFQKDKNDLEIYEYDLSFYDNSIFFNLFLLFILIVGILNCFCLIIFIFRKYKEVKKMKKEYLNELRKNTGEGSTVESKPDPVMEKFQREALMPALRESKEVNFYDEDHYSMMNSNDNVFNLIFDRDGEIKRKTRYGGLSGTKSIVSRGFGGV